MDDGCCEHNVGFVHFSNWDLQMLVTVLDCVLDHGVVDENEGETKEKNYLLFFIFFPFTP